MKDSAKEPTEKQPLFYHEQLPHAPILRLPAVHAHEKNARAHSQASEFLRRNGTLTNLFHGQVDNEPLPCALVGICGRTPWASHENRPAKSLAQGFSL